ncbi:MAG: lipopolysaccharide biosynthesis protein [Methylobacter sp.]
MKKRVAISIVDQGLVSAFNFALNLMLIKAWSPQEYGKFGIILSVGLLLVGIQNAMVNTPASVMLPTATTGLKKRQLRTLFSVVNILICIAAFLSSYLFALFPELDLGMPTVNAIGYYLATTLFREYLRNRAIVVGRLKAVLIDDGFFVILAAAELAYAYLYLGPHVFSLSFCLNALALANLMIMLSSLISEIRSILQSPWQTCKELYPGVWKEASWSLIGVATTEAQNRGYVFVIGAFFGTAAVGSIQAGRVFFGPLNLITSAWSRVARPHLSVLVEDRNSAKFFRLMGISVLSFIVLNIAFSSALWFAWPFLNLHFFGDKYSGVILTVILWALATLLFQIRSVCGVGVQACRKFRQLALTTVIGAVVSMGALMAVCWADMSEWAVTSVIAGEVVAAAGIFYILARTSLTKVSRDSRDE